MSRAIAWFVHNPVAANLFMAVLIVGGLLALPAVHQEEFPSIDMDIVRVTVPYLGAAPEETESGICIRIEEAIDGTQGVDRISSLAVEGACTVTLELDLDGDSNAALDEIKNRVDGITTFPAEAERPVVSALVLRNGVIQLALRGQADARTLKVVGQRVRDELTTLPGISQVDLQFTKPYEISIELSEVDLRRHGLTFDYVARAVRQRSLDLPGGTVRAKSGEILLRTKGQVYEGTEFADIVVMTHSDGTTVTLGEIARVRDGFQDGDLFARFRGEPAVLIRALRVGQEDSIGIARQVLAYADRSPAWLPDGLTLEPFHNEAAQLTMRLDALLSNARSGLVLVLVILGLFLRFRLAMWVAAGVPVAFLGALATFPFFDISISTLTIMAFILVIGIVVDDAIVIGESVYRREQSGENQIDAAIKGTRDVYVPVIFGVLTTVAAFLPLVLVPGRMGRFFSVVGVTAILCLVFSLLESQLILPSHLAHRRLSSRTGGSNRASALWQRVQGRTTRWLEHLGDVRYASALRLSLDFRYVTVAIAVGVIILALSLFASGRLRYQFFPATEGDVVYASLTMPRGTPISITSGAIEQIEGAARRLQAEIEEEFQADAVLHVLTTVGDHQGRNGPPDISVSTGGSHLGEVSIELIPSTERDFESGWVANRWRVLTGPVTDAVELKFAAEAFSAGHPIDIRLAGGDVAQLTRAADRVKAELSTFVGVSDLSDSFRAGKQEVKLALRPAARPLGLTLDDLARQVRQAFYGEEIQRIQRGRDDVRVMLRFPEGERASLGFLEEMRIRTTDGAEVPFASVAEATLGRGYASIRRSDRMRIVSVTGEVDRTVTTPEAVLAQAQARIPELLLDYPGVRYSLEGEQREHGTAVQGLIRGGVVALLLIYALLAIPLGSYTQPLVIMSVIPFGTVGAVVGHYIMGWDLVFFSVLGIVALSGVVVNASLVLVHSVNRRRAEGTDLDEAVVGAGVTRFRPIVLTSATTYIGLVPLMFIENIQTKMMVPMAISLGYGVIFSAIVSLFLVPSLYVILEDLQSWRSHRAGASPAEIAPSELSSSAL